MNELLFGRDPRVTLIRIAALIASAIVVFGFVLLPVRLHGISMQPTYNDGALNFANRAAYWFRAPARGDAVAIRMAGPSVVYVKRIVGLPGERVSIAKGVVLVNGAAIAEPAVVYRKPWDLQPITLGRDEYLVIGDNRGMSIQDHAFGKASRDRIIGKMLF